MKLWPGLKIKNYFHNIGYFFKEAKTMFQLNCLSNIFTILSTALVFFILAMVVSGWWISNQLIEVIQKEAEINVYFDEDIDNERVIELVKKINSVQGVDKARLVSEQEAYDRMVEILGKEAKVLEFFDDNPFTSFIEVKIHLEEINRVLENLETIKNIKHIRDNREILERIASIARLLRFSGYLVVTAVGISTLVIISHIIQQGIYNNREQINTLRLLGAPEGFIAFPFLLKGLLLTLGGGILASALAVLALNQIYAYISFPLPFIPLPHKEVILPSLVTLVILLSIVLGLLGSVFGLSSAKNN